jgi:hypothetical protein
MLLSRANEAWLLISPPPAYRADACAASSPAGKTSTGRAASAVYRRDEEAEVVLASYVYADAAAARRVLSGAGARAAVACQRREAVESLRRAGYEIESVHEPPATDVDIGEEARTRTLEVASLYRGTHVTWHIDDTSMRGGRIFLIVQTIAPRRYATGNQALSRELARLVP